MRLPIGTCCYGTDSAIQWFRFLFCQKCCTVYGSSFAFFIGQPLSVGYIEWRLRQNFEFEILFFQSWLNLNCADLSHFCKKNLFGFICPYFSGRSDISPDKRHSKFSDQNDTFQMPNSRNTLWSLNNLLKFEWAHMAPNSKPVVKVERCRQNLNRSLHDLLWFMNYYLATHSMYLDILTASYITEESGQKENISALCVDAAM